MQRTGRPRNYRDDMPGKKPRRFRQTLGNQVAVTVLGLSVAFLISTFDLPQLDQSKQKLQTLLTTDTDFNRCVGQIEAFLKNNEVTGRFFEDGKKPEQKTSKKREEEDFVRNVAYAQEPQPSAEPANPLKTEFMPGVGPVTDGFGERIHPITGNPSNHNGADIAENTGTPVIVPYNGTVTETGYNDVYGNYVKVDHHNGIETFYGHCDTITCAVNDQVTAGQSIATVGSTGLSTGSHLHFSLIINGEYKNPEDYFDFAKGVMKI